MSQFPTDEQILALAVADGWHPDTSPNTEMSNERWYRWDNCTPAVTEETLIERYWSKMKEGEPDYDTPKPINPLENWQQNDDHNVP
jgi:hypothetical protein